MDYFCGLQGEVSTTPPIIIQSRYYELLTSKQGNILHDIVISASVSLPTPPGLSHLPDRSHCWSYLVLRLPLIWGFVILDVGQSQSKYSQTISAILLTDILLLSYTWNYLFLILTHSTHTLDFAPVFIWEYSS